MSIEGRIAELQRKHEALDAQIDEMKQRPACCPTELRHLKRKKLHCKDEIARLSNPLRRTAPKPKKSKVKPVCPPQTVEESPVATLRTTDPSSDFEVAA